VGWNIIRSWYSKKEGKYFGTADKRLGRHGQFVMDFPGIAQVAPARRLGVEHDCRRQRQQHGTGDAGAGGHLGGGHCAQLIATGDAEGG
jgi:hypothetical protein